MTEKEIVRIFSECHSYVEVVNVTDGVTGKKTRVTFADIAKIITDQSETIRKLHAENARLSFFNSESEKCVIHNFANNIMSEINCRIEHNKSLIDKYRECDRMSVELFEAENAAYRTVLQYIEREALK